MRIKLLACEIFYREFCAAVARSVHRVDIQFLPKALHDVGQAAMSSRLRETLAAIDETHYDAIALGYGLCNNGIVGLSARTRPLVVPRAHDCITFFLGDKQRYHDYFFSHPGVYFKTSGWIERGDGLQPVGSAENRSDESIVQRMGMLPTFDELVEKYGADNAQYLWQQLGQLRKNYGGLTYIATGVEPDDRFEQQARREAEELGWKFERIAGTLELFEALVNGRWDDERFLVVPPGWSIQPSFDDCIVKASPPPSDATKRPAGTDADASRGPSEATAGPRATNNDGLFPKGETAEEDCGR